MAKANKSAEALQEELEAAELKNSVLIHQLEQMPTKASLTSDFEAPIFKVDGKTYKLNFGEVHIPELGGVITAAQIAADKNLQKAIVNEWQGCVTEI